MVALASMNNRQGYSALIFNSALIKNMKTPLITKEGLEKLKAELDHLWRVERPDTTQKVSWAASLGDRSENADYQL